MFCIIVRDLFVVLMFKGIGNSLCCGYVSGGGGGDILEENDLQIFCIVRDQCWNTGQLEISAVSQFLYRITDTSRMADLLCGKLRGHSQHGESNSTGTNKCRGIVTP